MSMRDRLFSFFPGTLINLKEIRTIDSLLRYTRILSREKQWQHKGRRGWDKSDNIFLWFLYSDVSPTQRKKERERESQPRQHVLPHIYTQAQFTLRKPIHKLRNIYANSRRIQTMSRHCGCFYFLKNGERGRYVGRTSGGFQSPFPYLRPLLFPVSSLAIHHRIFVLFYRALSLLV